MKTIKIKFKVILVFLLTVVLISTGTGRAQTVVPAGISFYDFAYENFKREGILAPDFYDYQLGSYNLKNYLSYNDKYYIPVNTDNDHLIFFNIIEEKISTENPRLVLGFFNTKFCNNF